MRTVEWIVGNCLLDPVHVSKVLILYGKGGTGKSTLMAAIKGVLRGCCGTISERSMTSAYMGLDSNVASTILSNRIVTAGDVSPTGSSTNTSVIKALTGHDHISVPPMSGRSFCSLVYSSNSLDDPTVNTEWKTAAIMRRVVVLHMCNDVLSEAPQMIPEDSIGRLDFALRCVHTRMKFPNIPVSPMSVILTLLGEKHKEVVQYMAEEEEDKIDHDQHMLILSLIAAAIAIDAEEVANLASKISLDCVKESKGKKVRRKIKPAL